MKHYGPTLAVSKDLHQTKYRSSGESFYEAMTRVADALKDSDEHFREFRDILLEMRFMPGGRVQSAMGASRNVTGLNCFVSGVIEDSLDSIMKKAHEAAETMRQGGGIGYDFSNLRPNGDRIVSLDSKASGPVSFMSIFDAICHTIASAGHRRGAQMGTLRIDHPDIEQFIRSKQNQDQLRAFNISVGVTDEFMMALEADGNFDLKFEGKVYKTIKAKALWEEIMRSTWDWAEPGVLFIDTAHKYNNLWYRPECELIATNPCGEIWLPEYGACLLGSFNLTKYIKKGRDDVLFFDINQFSKDIPPVVRAMDNIIDRTKYPLERQRQQMLNERRMGLGITGLANAAEILGMPYGSADFLAWEDHILNTLKNEVYQASIELASEKGSFPFFDRDRFLEGYFIKTLPESIRTGIYRHGIRNSHLLAIAPTGTISLCADNISSGIEPVFSHQYDRTIQTFDGPMVETVTDYAWREHKIKGRTADEVSAQEHLEVLITAQRHIDNSVSKTCNVSPTMPWEEFKDIYVDAWKGGCKGVTTFNVGGKRFGILTKTTEIEEGAEACYIDPATGQKSCG